MKKVWGLWMDNVNICYFETQEEAKEFKSHVDCSLRFASDILTVKESEVNNDLVCKRWRC